MNHAANRTKQKGFTIIELLLAMSFVSMLLLAIAMTIVQIANIYNRGLIVKSVNETSRQLGEELNNSMRTTSVFSLDEGTNRYVSEDWGGRLCLGQYSYIWNYAEAVSAQNTNRYQYSGDAEAGNVVVDQAGQRRNEIGFVKVPDGSGAYCVRNVDTDRYPDVNPENSTELLRSGDHTLSLHSFALDTSTTARDSLSGQQLYKLAYTLGTSDVSLMNRSAAGKFNACKTPAEGGSDVNFCVVQNFSLVFRVTNGVN